MYLHSNDMNSLKEKNLLKSYWRAKQALHGEADRKLGIAVHARMLYIYNMCCTFITWRVHERFYRLDLKKEEMVILDNSP